MNDEATFQEIVEQRRRAWSAPTSAEAERFKPVSPQTEETSHVTGHTSLEDTVPLPRYRPDRL